MPLLYVASLEHGYVSDEAMLEVAELTGLTPAQVQSVASFYTMYRRAPVGEYVVSVCTSISCWLRGADDVLDAIADEAGVVDGETSTDGRITVEHVECGGACGGAPALCRELGAHRGDRAGEGPGPGPLAPRRPARGGFCR